MSKERHVSWLAIDDLVLPKHGGNRGVKDAAHIKKIAANFDPCKLGVFTVGPADERGKFTIINGQHRWSALHGLLGWRTQRVPCLVEETADTRAQQSKVFGGLNDHRMVRPVDRFRNLVFEGQPDAVAMNAVVERAGFAVGHTTTTTTISAVGALEHVYHRLGGDGLSSVLALAIGAWGKVPSAMHGEILRGLGWVLYRHGETIDRAALIVKLRNCAGGPGSIVAKAKGARDTQGSSVSNNVAALFVIAYNKGRRGNSALPNWWTK